MKNCYILLSLLLSLSLFSCKKSESPLNGQIVFFIGSVTVDGTPITRVNHLIKYGSIIETGEKSLCRIQAGEKSLFQINENSKVIYKISPKENTIQLDKGWMAGITRKVFTKTGTYKIKTPTVTASIRGTSYCIKIENPKSSYFCVCNGTINLQGESEQKGSDVTAAHHAAKRFKLDKNNKLIIESPGMLYHMDADIEKLAKELNETVDWSKAH